MPRYHDGVELDELLLRLKKLRAKFPEDKNGKGGAGKEDEFLELEESFLKRRTVVEDMIKTINSDTSSIQDQIRLKRNVHNELQGLKEIIEKMEQSIQKEKKNVLKNKSKVAPEELTRRETNFLTFLDVFRTIHSELRSEKEAFGKLSHVTTSSISREELFGTAGSSTSGSTRNFAQDAALHAGIGMRNGGGDVAPGESGLSAEQEQQLQEINRINQEQDQIIDEIGDLIKQAQQIADTIHETVKTQNEMLTDVEKDIDTQHENLIGVNSTLKKTLEAKGMSWERMCIAFVCLILILGLVGVIVTGL